MLLLSVVRPARALHSSHQLEIWTVEAAHALAHGRQVGRLMRASRTADVPCRHGVRCKGCPREARQVLPTVLPPVGRGQSRKGVPLYAALAPTRTGTEPRERRNNTPFGRLLTQIEDRRTTRADFPIRVIGQPPSATFPSHNPSHRCALREVPFVSSSLCRPAAVRGPQRILLAAAAESAPTPA